MPQWRRLKSAFAARICRSIRGGGKLLPAARRASPEGSEAQRNAHAQRHATSFTDKTVGRQMSYAYASASASCFLCSLGRERCGSSNKVVHREGTKNVVRVVRRRSVAAQCSPERCVVGSQCAVAPG